MLNRPPPPKPPEDRAFLRAFIHFVIVMAAIFGIWYYYGRETPAVEAAPAPVAPSNQTISAPVAPPAPAPPAPSSPPPTESKPSDLVTLESIDGRSIKAQVLVITDTSVFIRREDGQTFDLPFTRLTPEAKQRVLDARTNRIFGVKN